MKEKTKRTIIGIVIIIFSIIISLVWFFYASINYDHPIMPWDIIGIDNPEKYYQKNIAKRLERYGKEYTLDHVDTSDWKIYRNEEYGFEVKYPKEGKIGSGGLGMPFENSNGTRGCITFIQQGDAWGMYDEFLPKKKRMLISRVKRLWKIWYIKSNNDISYFVYMGNKKMGNRDKYPSESSYIEVLLIGKKPENYIMFIDKRKCPIEIREGMLQTFRFID